MANSDLGEVLALIGLLAALSVAVAIVWIARDYDSATQWATVAALAASVQAIAVVGGLLYAGRQLQTSRELEERRRNREIVDRAASTTFDELIPSLRKMGATMRSMRWHHHQYNRDTETDEDPERRAQIRDELHKPEYRKLRSELREAEQTARNASARLRRHYVALGRDRRVVVYQAYLDAYTGPILPFDIDGEWPADEPGDRFEKTCRALEDELVELIRSTGVDVAG